MRHIKHIIILFTAVIALLPMRVAGQSDERISAHFYILTQEDPNDTPQLSKELEFALFKTYAKAERTMLKLRESLKSGNDDEFRNIVNDVKNPIKFKKIKANGEFSVRAFAGQGILVHDKCSHIMAVYEIKEGKTEYEEVVKRTMEDVWLPCTGKTGKQTYDTGTIPPPPPPPSGNPVVLEFDFFLPKKLTGEKTRIMLQPYAVDCQTDDTVDFVTPIVFEGDKYHMLQNRRMNFDYSNCEIDSISNGYIDSSSPKDGESFHVKAKVKYYKKNGCERKKYKFPFDIVIEDYTHEIFRKQSSADYCVEFNYFKFLNLNAISADMRLEEFAIDAEETMKSVPRDLRLNFLVGKSELTNDSLNDVRLNMLIKEMKEYGDQLMRVEIEAHASPDGDARKNLQLAEQRGRVAMNMVMRALGRVDITKKVTTTVYTWNNVADELEKRGEKGKADTVRAITEANTKPDAVLRSLPFYQTHIDTILQDMRSMRCVYKYEQMHIMDADELTDYYTNNKQKLINGDKDVKLSDGDYYNLFVCMTDSAELDTITMLAYRHMTSQRGWENLKFSQYVANRMAILRTRQGHPDPSILDPFIDTGKKYVTNVNTDFDNDEVLKNRKELLINYIVAYYQLEKIDTASYYLNKWFSGKEKQDAQVSMLQKYVNFKNLFTICKLAKEGSAEQERQYDEAEDFIMKLHPDNRAIWYTEARKVINKTDDECLSLVSRMSDENPKKWYLLGVLEAAKEEKNINIKNNKDEVPYYLALFYKSFTIDPSLRLTYFDEAHVSSSLRDKYKYRKRDIPRYKELFNEKYSPEATDDEEVQLSGGDDEEEENSGNGDVGDNTDIQ